MIEKVFGAVSLILRPMEALKGCRSCKEELFICLCFLHLENLCAQILEMFHIVVKTVNAIKNKLLKHRQFQYYIFRNCWNMCNVV